MGSSDKRGGDAVKQARRIYVRALSQVPASEVERIARHFTQRYMASWLQTGRAEPLGSRVGEAIDLLSHPPRRLDTETVAVRIDTQKCVLDELIAEFPQPTQAPHGDDARAFVDATRSTAHAKLGHSWGYSLVLPRMVHRADRKFPRE